MTLAEQLTGWIDITDHPPEIAQHIRLRTYDNDIVHGYKTVDDDYWIPSFNNWFGGDGKLFTHRMPMENSNV